MSNNNLIDRYFDGEMSEMEMKEFENSVHNDPVLEKEFLFQQEIIKSIKSARMAELKANLNTIDVSGIATGTSSAWFYKTVASVVVVGGAITYFTLFTDDASHSKNDFVAPIEQIETESPESIEEIGQLPSIELDKFESEKTQLSNEPNLSETAPSMKEEVIEKVKDTETSSLESPDITDDFGDIDDAASNASPPDNELIDKGAFEHSTINIEINSTKQKYNFHYQLKGNTLYLYGIFDKVYEVLEFKHNDNSDLFFYYDHTYYDINDSKSGIIEFQALEEEELSELKQKIFNNEEAKSQ